RSACSRSPCRCMSESLGESPPRHSQGIPAVSVSPIPEPITACGSERAAHSSYAWTTPGTYQLRWIVAAHAVGMMTYPPHIARPGKSLVLFGGAPRVSSSGTVVFPPASTAKAAPLGGLYAWAGQVRSPLV